jgi:hypothetical protein
MSYVLTCCVPRAVRCATWHVRCDVLCDVRRATCYVLLITTGQGLDAWEFSSAEKFQ